MIDPQKKRELRERLMRAPVVKENASGVEESVEPHVETPVEPHIEEPVQPVAEEHSQPESNKNHEPAVEEYFAPEIEPAPKPEPVTETYREPRVEPQRSPYSPRDYAQNSPKEHKSKAGIWVLVILGLLVAASIVFAILYIDRSSGRYEERGTTVEDGSGQTENYDTGSDYEYYDQNSSGSYYNEPEPSGPSDRAYEFIMSGDFYGYIGDEFIRGNLTLDTDVPHGSFYNDYEGLYYDLEGTPSGRSWTQYRYDDETGEYLTIATWYFSHWDLEDDNFAIGNFIRDWDGYTLPVYLYKDND